MRGDVIPPAFAPADEFPYARCATCARGAGCDALGGTPPDFPACFAPLLHVSVERVRAILAEIERREPQPALAPLAAAIVADFAGARHRFSETFEASVSVSQDGTRVHRYTYALPELGNARGIVQAIDAVATSFGDPARAACARVFRAARHPAVAFVLVGAATDRDGTPSLKLYLQLRDDAGASAWELARGLVPSDEQHGSLHLLGVAIDPSGVRAAKIYTIHEELPSEVLFASLAVAAPFGPRVRGAIVATKLVPPLDTRAARTREIFVPLPPNELRQDALARWTSIPHVGAALAALEPMRSVARLAIRGVTLGAPPSRKANVYYTVTDVDPS